MSGFSRCGAADQKPQYLVADEFSTAEWWKSWKSFHKKVCRKAKKMLDRTPYCAIYCWIASLSPFWDQKYPIIGDEFLRRIQPWRELFSPRSVIARKFMAFWPAWAPRTAARSSMLAVLRAARAWLSDPAFYDEIRRRTQYAHKRPLILDRWSYFIWKIPANRKNFSQKAHGGLLKSKKFWYTG